MKERPPVEAPGASTDPVPGTALGLIDHIAEAYARAARGAGAAGPDLSGEQIGRYCLLERISRGGMGDVYRARRADGAYDAEVAVKLLRASLNTEALTARFRQERQILARLQHPHIAHLLDGGTSAEGSLYLVMELVDGVPLSDFAVDRNLDLDARLELFETVCDAVAYAHRSLVVHRDLKPSNILVTDDGTVKLVDFGIGKLLEEPDGEIAPLTRTGLLPMTPAYAAPEQILGQPVTTATDVYGLGVVLYELLTGRRPHARDTQPLTALAATVDTEVTTRPSEVLRRQGETEVERRRARELRGDLDTIVLTALQRDPDRRYASAEALVADLRRYRRGEPIHARPDTTAYRVGKFLRRHRLGVAAAGFVILALTVGLAVALWQASQAREQAQRAAAVQEFLVDIFLTNSSRQPDPLLARQTTARELLDLGAAEIETAMDVAPAAKLNMLELLGELYHELAIDDEAVRLRREAVELARTVHGASSAELAEALLALAHSMANSSSPGERQAVLEEAADVLDRRRDFTSPLRGRLLAMQSHQYASSDVEKALDYAKRAVDVFERSGPPEDLAEALYVRGVTESLTGNDARAVASLVRAVNISRAVHGFPNPALVRFYAVMGDAQFRQLDIAGARHSLRQALRAAMAIHGEEHVDTLQAKMRLGKRLFESGRTPEGLELLRQARDLAFELRGPDDPFHTAHAMLAHGYALARAGKLREGLAEMQEAIAVRRRHRMDSLYHAQMLESAAGVVMEMGRYGRAEGMLEEAAAIRERGGQPRGGWSWNHHLAMRIRLHLARGEVDTAQELLDTLAFDGDALVPTSLSGIEHLVLRAQIRYAAGDDSGARVAARQVRRAIETAGLEKDLEIQLATADLIAGRAALRQGRPATALPLLEAALERRNALYLPESVHVEEAMVALAGCLLELDDVGAARRLAEQAKAVHAAHGEVADHHNRLLERLLDQLPQPPPYRLSSAAVAPPGAETPHKVAIAR